MPQIRQMEWLAWLFGGISGGRVHLKVDATGHGGADFGLLAYVAEELPIVLIRASRGLSHGDT
ncbi:MAG TPA: hypothetical protein VK728_04590 [Candidatus Sulfotelmatobacter sp.]|nr:hypothetical protein [Candidatus Sulfotelmatobacter sp.]